MITISIFEHIFSKPKYQKAETVVISIPADIYCQELALYTVSSLIGNAISKSEMLCFRDGKAVKNEDYYRLNVAPNENETSSYFWHKIINSVIRNGEALVVETSDGAMYCAESYSTTKQPIKGDIYTNVALENFTFLRSFDTSNSYTFRLNNINATKLLNGLYNDWSRLLSAARNDFIKNHSNRYKIKIDGIRAGDKDFNKIFEEIIKKQIKDYFETDDAIYPEYEGYELVPDDKGKSNYGADDFIKLRKEYFEIAAGAYHVPLSMMTGNITNMGEIISSFLSFSVDPFADMITESLNKGAGLEHFVNGDYFKVDTSYNNHTDIFSNANNIAALISSGYACIDELRIKNGDPPLNTEWSRKHYITKNFDNIEAMCAAVPSEGGENE